MNKYLTLTLLLLCATLYSQRLKVHDSGRYLVKETGEPFFWMADTAWELFHRCSREEAQLYLKKRSSQGFNVIQAVALAELNGLNDPNPYGNTPLLNNDPLKPNEAYFEHVEYIIDLAAEMGIYIALLPTWGDKLYKSTWGDGPEIFNTQNAKQFGTWIGKRFKDKDNLIWIIGGDRTPRPESSDVEIWNQMAEGVVQGAGGYDRTLMGYHPQPKEGGGSSTWFHNEKWLDFNMHQTGHCANQGTYTHIQHDYELRPVKPVLDGEPLYEDHPNCFNAKDLGYSVADDIRRIMYWNVFAGAFGQTYGCHDVWQMYDLDKKPVNTPLRPWKAALDLPMANQVKHLKNLMLSRPFLTRIPDQTMIVENNGDFESHIMATRDKNGSYALVYLPMGGKTLLNLESLSGEELSTWWYDTRTGASFKGEPIKRSTSVEIVAPSSGKGNDWVLVIDSDVFDRPGNAIKP